MTFNIMLTNAIVLFALCIVASTIGYYKFTESLTYQYNDAALRTADTALALINADEIDGYLAAEGEDPNYQLSLQRLQILANKQNVSVVYVIRPNTEDWSTYISVFNAPSDTSGYTPWEINSVHDTSNAEYVEIYRKMYNEGLKQANVVRDHGLSGSQPHITVLIPVTRTDGTVAGIMCVQRFMDQLAGARKDYTLLVFSVTLGLTVLLVVLIYVYARRQFVRPLQTIIGETKRFAETGSMEGSLLGNKLSRVHEIKQLAKEVEVMEEEIVSYTNSLTEAVAERERIGTELKVATAIQEGTLPHNFDFSNLPEIDLYATMNPAKEVGGDFYDFLLLDEDHLALVIADVSGKGVPAALYMMISDILIKERALMGGSPAEVLAHVNRRICLNNKAEMFVTAWLGILELSTGKLVAANAGHEDPAFMPAGGEFTVEKMKHGVVLGGINTAKFRDYEMQLKSGDKLFLYTDGLPEATRGDNTMLRVEGMLNSLNQHKDGSPKEILDHIWADVQDFVGDAPQFDDLTMMCVQFNGKNADNTLVVEADDRHLDQVIAYIDERLPFDPRTRKKMAIAVEEVFVNVAHYAYTQGGEVRITVTKTDKGIAIQFADKGKPFDPLAKPDPDLTLDADEREIGGLGIYMTKKLCDKVSYVYEDGENRLTMEKYYGQD